MFYIGFWVTSAKDVKEGARCSEVCLKWKITITAKPIRTISDIQNLYFSLNVRKESSDESRVPFIRADTVTVTRRPSLSQP